MAEATLVKEVLTDDMIAAGAAVTRALDAAGWPVVASLWLFDAESNQWRLVLASPTVTQTGPLAAYRRVGEALGALNLALPLGGLSVVPPDDPTVRALASAFRPGMHIEGRRVSRTAINGLFVDDAYLYRIKSVVPAA